MADVPSADALATLLVMARRSAVPIEIRELETIDIEQAYAIQDEVTALTTGSGDGIIGYKVGLTSPASMAAFSATEPILGPMFASSVLQSREVLHRQRMCDARIEGEILIEIGNPPARDCDDEALVASIASLRPAIEIADSRVLGWPSSAPLAIADDACCGWVVVGAPVSPERIDLAAVTMELTADGEMLSSGVGANCLGTPLAVYRWFLAKAAALGWPVSTGQLLLTGALGPPVPVGTYGDLEASLSNLGSVSLLLRADDDL